MTRLIHIIEKCTESGWGYACGETSDYMCGALANEWTEETLCNPDIKDMYNSGWVSYAFNNGNINEDLVDEICQAADKYPYITIDVNSSFLDHCFVVCNTDQGRIRADSYVGIYPPTCQPIDLRETLLSIVNELSPETWNRLFGTNYSNVDVNREGLWLEYSCCDEAVEGTVYHNRVKRL